MLFAKYLRRYLGKDKVSWGRGPLLKAILGAQGDVQLHDIIEKMNDQRQDKIIMQTFSLRALAWYDGSVRIYSEGVRADFGAESLTIDLPNLEEPTFLEFAYISPLAWISDKTDAAVLKILSLPDQCLVLEALLDVTHYDKLTLILDRIRCISKMQYKTSRSPIMDLGVVEKESWQSICNEIPTTDPFRKPPETPVEATNLDKLSNHLMQARGCSAKVLHVIKVGNRRLHWDQIPPLKMNRISEIKIRK